MKVAILSRPGACFPNIISTGLSVMLEELGVENNIFYDSMPMLMRLLPFGKKPRRWHNNLQYRVRNKLAHFAKDKALLKTLNGYDAIILSECYPNAFWKNYFALQELKAAFKGPLISYTDSPLDAAPLHRVRHLNSDDYDESIYDFNLFVTDTIEVKTALQNNQAAIGINIAGNTALRPLPRQAFTAIVDFAQPGYDAYRQQQLRVLAKLGINTIVLQGRYPIEEIRKIYSQAAVFFLAFPETFGLPIAECLASGTMVFTPDSAWPMAWRLDKAPMPMGQGILPDCFQVYSSDEILENKLTALQQAYHPENTPQAVFNTFLQYYRPFYDGNKAALQSILQQLKKDH